LDENAIIAVDLREVEGYSLFVRFTFPPPFPLLNKREAKIWIVGFTMKAYGIVYVWQPKRETKVSEERRLCR